MVLNFKPRMGNHAPYQLDDTTWCVVNRKTGQLVNVDIEDGHWTGDIYAHHKWAKQRAKQLNEGES